MLNLLEQKKTRKIFSQEAEVYIYDVHNDSILGILREYGERFIALFNFSERADSVDAGRRNFQKSGEW